MANCKSGKEFARTLGYLGLLLTAAILVAAGLIWPSAALAQGVPAPFRLTHLTVRPIMPAELAAGRPSTLTPEELAALRQRMEENRERVQKLNSKPFAKAVNPAGDPSIAPVRIVSGKADIRAQDGLIVGRNERNRIAEFSGALSEPAAINNRNRVYYTGNFHFEQSTDHGVTYTATTVPPGPADAPDFCCDNDVTVDPATGTGIHVVLYVRSAGDNGVLGVQILDANDFSNIKCSYLLDSAGTADNEVQDFPKIALSKNDAYISASVFGAATAGYSRMYRIDKAELLSCANISIGIFDQPWTIEGQRVWRPAGGAEGRMMMMWAHHIDETHMRVFKWLEADGAPTSVVRTVSPSVFGPVDCRGGVGNFEWNGGAFPAGFTTSCAMASGIDQQTPVLTCFNHSAPMTGRPQAFLRGTVFRASDRKLLSEPDLYSTDMCWGYPIITSNARGDIGFSLAGGGSLNGGLSAVQGYVGLRTPSGTEVSAVAGGVANQASGRFGDYFTIHRYQGCSKFFGATAYAWDKAPVVDNQGINARWVEFGRFGDTSCWQNRQ